MRRGVPVCAHAARAPRSPRRAFTLLEVLAALAVFLLGVVGVLALLTSGTRLHQQSRAQVAVGDLLDEVAWLACREIAAAPAVEPESGRAPPSLEPRPVPGRDGFLYTYAVRASETGSPLLLEIEIRWLEGARPQTARSLRALQGSTDLWHQVRALRAGRQQNGRSGR